MRVVPLRPTAHYPWYAIWRSADRHPTLPRLVAAVRAAGSRPDPTDKVWLPQVAREPPGRTRKGRLGAGERRATP